MLINSGQAASILGCSRNTVLQMIRRGELTDRKTRGEGSGRHYPLVDDAQVKAVKTATHNGRFRSPQAVPAVPVPAAVVPASHGGALGAFGRIEAKLAAIVAAMDEDRATAVATRVEVETLAVNVEILMAALGESPSGS